MPWCCSRRNRVQRPQAHPVAVARTKGRPGLSLKAVCRSPWRGSRQARRACRWAWRCSRGNRVQRPQAHRVALARIRQRHAPLLRPLRCYIRPRSRKSPFKSMRLRRIRRLRRLEVKSTAEAVRAEAGSTGSTAQKPRGTRKSLMDQRCSTGSPGSTRKNHEPAQKHPGPRKGRGIIGQERGKTGKSLEDHPVTPISAQTPRSSNGSRFSQPHAGRFLSLPCESPRFAANREG